MIADRRADAGDDERAEYRQGFDNSVLTEIRIIKKLADVEKCQTDCRQRRGESKAKNQR